MIIPAMRRGRVVIARDRKLTQHPPQVRPMRAWRVERRQRTA